MAIEKQAAHIVLSTYGRQFRKSTLRIYSIDIVAQVQKRRHTILFYAGNL